jgi:hypothetical protein
VAWRERLAGRSGGAVFEELFEPGIELVGVEMEVMAEVGDGNLVEEVAFEAGDLVGGGKVTSRLLVHKGTSAQARLTRRKRFSRSD